MQEERVAAENVQYSKLGGARGVQGQIPARGNHSGHPTTTTATATTTTIAANGV